jgi:hypothetical protein
VLSHENDFCSAAVRQVTLVHCITANKLSRLLTGLKDSQKRSISRHKTGKHLYITVQYSILQYVIVQYVPNDLELLCVFLF